MSVSAAHSQPLVPLRGSAQIPSASRPDQPPESLTKAQIGNALNYVAPGENRVLEVSMFAPNWISALIEFRSPSYTAVPVDYLNLSELTVSLAQTGHVLFDALVRREEFAYRTILSPDRLAQLRLLHKVYFSKFSVSFQRRHPNRDYRIELRLLRTHMRASVLFGRFTFQIGETISGVFTGTIDARMAERH